MYFVGFGMLEILLSILQCSELFGAFSALQGSVPESDGRLLPIPLVGNDVYA